MDREQEIQEIRQKISTCTLCKLAKSRKNVVPGEGPLTSRIMFIGEAPGFHENEQGKPFVGAAGHFLDELLEQTGVKRSEVFITNVIKCRPPSNRDPEEEELLACRAYLDAQIKVINPEIIVTLGRFSMGMYFENGKISAIHGHPKRLKENLLIVPMYHPAAALHQPALRNVLLEDFRKLKDLLNHFDVKDSATMTKEDFPVKKEEESIKNESPQQLSLFG